MKKVGQILAEVGKKSAETACDSVSAWWIHQPKEPACLKKKKTSISKNQ